MCTKGYICLGGIPDRRWKLNPESHLGLCATTKRTTTRHVFQPAHFQLCSNVCFSFRRLRCRNTSYQMTFKLSEIPVPNRDYRLPYAAPPLTFPNDAKSPNPTQYPARHLCGVWWLFAGLPVFIRPHFRGGVPWAPSASAARVALPPDTPQPGHYFNGPGTPVPSLQG